MRALCRNYEAQLTTLFSGYIGSLLQQARGALASIIRPLGRPAASPRLALPVLLPLTRRSMARDRSPQASSSPNMWKAKDAAVYLVIALTLRGSTAKLGATQTNQAVNLMDFYNSAVCHAGARTHD